jgi:hypothetical protein
MAAREIVFALEFKGRGGPVAGSTTQRQARTTAPSQALRTVLAAGGISGSVEALPGESAVLESRVERFPDGTFVEDGTITYGRAGSISFDTVGRGHVGPAAGGTGSHGVVMWRIPGSTCRSEPDRYPFTDPAVRPCTMYSWKTSTRSTAGSAPRKPEAAITE